MSSAASDMEYWSSSYRRAVEELSLAVSRLRTQEASPELIEECERKRSRALGIKKSLALELRLTRDRSIKEKYQESTREYDKRCEALQAELDKAKLTSVSRRSRGRGEEKERSNDDYLSAADHLQDQTEQSLGRTMQMVEASKEVGESTLDELARQEAQMQAITADVTNIENNLARADKLIRNFGKRMMTDKLIQLFAFLNFTALFVVIVYVAVTGKGIDTSDSKKDNPDAGDE